ncbi:Auxin Efflux Carrier family protein [Tritrichomonas foetus]|uniref:Auxin Efflux Carrier family protein n=1 Tax=Tritrichomonas foetus TaxID=1144522 RepID=A0A1J4JX75_9EUKA|nr:Auxin Efflux Carrier family protein [Tritrichomonas foetus]|eukprot:OHT03753.1 Auxin Efflux Carrier family protein [Tritrichomonas foetus]
MVDYWNVMQVGIGMLIITAIGFTLGKLKIFKGSDVPIINKYVFKLNFIPLMARVIMVKKLSELNFMPLIDSALTSLATYFIVIPVFLFPFKDKFAMFLSVILPSAYINFVVSGLPVFVAIWGEGEVVVLSILTLANDLLVVPLYLVLSELYILRKNNEKRRDSGEPELKFTGKQALKILLHVMKSPILIGDIVGFVYAATTLPMPTYLKSLTTIMGDVVLPLSLFSVGIFLSQHSFIACHWLKFIVMLLIRHVISPLFAAVFAWALKFDNRLSRQCCLMTCSPTAVACYLITSTSGIGAGAASTMIFWTTVLSVPFIIGWIAVLDHLHIFVE